MNRRAKGNRNENRSAVMMENEGYYCMTSRASATAFDVSATYIGEDPSHYILQRLVQVKTNGGYAKSDIENLRLYSVMVKKSNPTCRIELHDWRKHRRTPIITIISDTKENDCIL